MSLLAETRVSTEARGQPPLVALRGVRKEFASGTVALAGLDLTVGRHEFVSLLGPSGCGKSTALRLIAGLAQPSAGRIELAAEATAGEVGFVFQEPTLLPWATVRDNVWLPLRLRGQSRRSATPEIESVLARVGLEQFGRAYPRELSGGMKMRVSIARALVTRPKLLLMDEPFAALDEITRLKLNNDLLGLWQSQSWTVVFVTHSVYESVYLSQRILVMAARPGRIVAELPVRRPLPARRELPHQRALQPVLPRGLGGSAPGDRGIGMAATDDGSTGGYRLARLLAPLLIGALLLLAWEAVVRFNGIPHYILPAPSLIGQELVASWGILLPSLLITLKIAALALLAAVVGGVGLAILCSLSKWVELSLFPYAVILQVTPVVSVAPLILIYVESTMTAVVLCAWLVAFFPILANTMLGLASADHNLRDLFELYRTSRWQQLRHFACPPPCPTSWAACASPAACR